VNLRDAHNKTGLADRKPDGPQRSFARGRRFTRRQLTRYRKSTFIVLCSGFLAGPIAAHWDQANDNPFRQCLAASSMQLTARTSVIAS
jgi:hypothetical protein